MGKAEYILDLELVSGELAFYLKNTLLRSATLNFIATENALLAYLQFSFLFQNIFSKVFLMQTINA